MEYYWNIHVLGTFKTLFSEIGVQNFPKLTKNQNDRSFARENGS